MKKQLCLLILCFPLFMMAQEDSNVKGIKWTTGLNWDQVKQKAKDENKYIFLDCYTTWCGPCKMMDKGTYVDDSVGSFFNDNFISVKVQFDKTEKDDEHARMWYGDADSIGKKYHVEGYPTFLFFNSNGEIVHKTMGFTPASDFIAVGKDATVPDKVYNDDYMSYDDFVHKHKNGERDYSRYPSMIITASKINDTAIFYQLQRELVQYMSSLPRNQRYTKDRIEMWSGFNIPSKSRVFNFFYNDGAIIDEVIGIKGYAADIVDRTIQQEICKPFMEEQAMGSGVAVSGMYLGADSLGAIATIAGEADWKKLYSIIKKKYGKRSAELGLLNAQIEWYARHYNVTYIVKYSLLKFKKFPPDINNGQIAVQINSVAWDAFRSSNDPKVLKQCIYLMEKLVHHPSPFSQAIDTYANLLYKTGQRQEAIEWQKKAVSMAPGNKQVIAALEDMKLGKPTYINQGAIWPKVKE